MGCLREGLAKHYATDCMCKTMNLMHHRLKSCIFCSMPRYAISVACEAFNQGLDVAKDIAHMQVQAVYSIDVVYCLCCCIVRLVHDSREPMR